VIVLAAGRALPEVAGSRRPLDGLSVALNACAFAALVVGGELALSRPMLGVLLLIGAAGSAMLLIHREAGSPAPLVPLDLLMRLPFRNSVIASIMCFTGQTAGLVALPIYLQHAFGLSPLVTGLYLTSWPFAVALTGPMAGKLASRVPTAWLCLAGGGDGAGRRTGRP
jgi:MFS transporter, DHA2 family, multidrug resistance protein